MKEQEIDSYIKKLDESKKMIQDVYSIISTNATREPSSDYSIKINKEQYQKLITLLQTDKINNGAIYRNLTTSIGQWETLKKQVKELKWEYINEVKLDRTIKTNSLVLRIASTIGVIVFTIIILNVADYFNFKVPWIATPTSTSSLISSVPKPNIQTQETKSD
jgi:hypothetical protein